MVKRFLCLAVLAVFCTSMLYSGITAGGGGSFSASYGSIDITSWQKYRYEAYNASPYLKLDYSSAALKADFQVGCDLQYLNGEVVQSAVIDRAYFRFRFPSFSGKKMTVTAGKAPVSWGMGSFYRAGDLLLEEPLQYSSAGTVSERSIYLVDVSQPLGAGFTAELAFVFPFESILKTGVLVSVDFDNPYFKELRAAYAYQKGGVHKASCVFDMSLYFDISIGAESSFRSFSDFRVVVNLMKQYSLAGESHSHLISLYLSSQLDFHSSSYDVMASVGASLTDRTSVSFILLTHFDNSGYAGSSAAAEVPLKLADGITMSVSAVLDYEQYSGSFSLIGNVRLALSF